MPDGGFLLNISLVFSLYFIATVYACLAILCVHVSCNISCQFLPYLHDLAKSYKKLGKVTCMHGFNLAKMSCHVLPRSFKIMREIFARPATLKLDMFG